jgi:5-(carboxyamino)imidazole ribonucleotide mutase
MADTTKNIDNKATQEIASPKIAICMGSQSDWKTMQEAAAILEGFEAPHEVKIISAHRTPNRLTQFAESAHEQGFAVIIAGAGGAAHLPGMLAAHTHLPVLGVPIESAALKGMDSLLSIVQMPAGVPVGTLAIGVPGAKNASLLAIQILALSDPAMTAKLIAWRAAQSSNVADAPS